MDQAIEVVNKELGKLGGSIDSSARIGKKQFARIMKKQKSGYYVVLVFSLDTEKIVKKDYDKLLENNSNKQKVDIVIDNYNEWKKSRKS